MCRQLLPFLLLLYALPWAAQASPRYRFSGTFDLEYAEHTTSPIDPASEHAQVDLVQKAEWNPHWTGILSGRGWVENICGNSGYCPAQVRKDDGYDIRFQDTYLQFKNDDWIVRVGNQQVVWGETFGTFIADVVNPKDLRYGYPMDLSRTELSTPMANVKYLAGSFSLQGLYIVQPQFNLLPQPGTDYGPSPQVPGFSGVVINREKSLPIGNGEFGARATESLGGADISIFGLSYYDRNPYYTLNAASVINKTLFVDENHARVGSGGAALAWAVGKTGYMIRAESLYTHNRVVSYLDNSFNITNLVTDEIAGAVSLEFPAWHRLNYAVQYSDSHLRDWANYLTRDEQDESYLTVRASLGLFESSTWDTIVTVGVADAGWRIQSEFQTPVNQFSEIHFGTEIYTGDSISDFGLLHRTSRVYVMLKGFFHG